MSRNKDQGTDWERDNLDEAHTRGLQAMYLRAMGINDMGDLWVGNPPTELGPRITALAWKRLTPTGGKRRSPMGERDVYILDRDTFWALLGEYLEAHPATQVVIECKAAERLSATRELAEAKRASGDTGPGYGGL